MLAKSPDVVFPFAEKKTLLHNKEFFVFLYRQMAKKEKNMV